MSRPVTSRDRSYQETELLRREAQQLKETIAALRNALEEAKAQQELASAKALAESNQEIGQMKSAIMSLREELEQLKIEGEREVEEALQNVERACRDEVGHLKQTIATLREQLETSHAQKG